MRASTSASSGVASQSAGSVCSVVVGYETVVVGSAVGATVETEVCSAVVGDRVVEGVVPAGVVVQATSRQAAASKRANLTSP